MTRRAHLGAISAAVVALVAAVVLMSSAHDANAAANLVANGDFANVGTVSGGWTALADTTVAWASGPTNDAAGDAGSGSAQVDWTNGSSGGFAVAEQSGCITLPGIASTYELVGSSKLAGTNDPLTAANLRVELFTDGACTAIDTLFDTTQNFANDNSWPVVSNTSVAVLATHLSARVQLMLVVNSGLPTGYFDNVSFSNGPVDTPTPTATNTAPPTDTGD